MVAEAKALFLGTGGENPQLVMTTDSSADHAPVKIAAFSRGNSVYALAVSPDGQRLAAATRKGQIRAYALRDFQAAPDAVPMLESFHVPGVTSLAFCTCDLLASGGVDGQVRIWCLSGKNRVGELKAHGGAVLSMCRIGSLLLATLGADAALRIWDLDSLAQVFARSEINLPALGAQISLQYDPASGLLMHPTKRGELHIYDLKNDCALRTVTAHQGDFSAIACNGLHVATAGHDDGLLKIWSRLLDRVEFQASVGSGVVSLGWAADRAIVTIDRAGNGRVWELDHRLRSSAPLGGTCYRACRGLPAEIIALQCSSAARVWRDAAVEEAKSLVERNDSESRRRLGLIIEELNLRGYATEAELVRAEAARAQGYPLDELQALLALSKLLGAGPSAVPALYGLGDALARLGETALAADAFRKVLSIEPSYQDTQQRLEVLQQETIDNVAAENLIRGDLADPELAVQEFHKCTILQRRFTSPIVLETRAPHRIDAAIAPSSLVEALTDQLNRLLPNQQRVELRRIRVLMNGHVRDGEWVYIHSPERASALGLALRTTTGSCEVTPHLIFHPTGLNLATPKEHNDAVEKALGTVARAGEAKDWFFEVERIVVDALHHLRNHALSQKSEGLF